MAPVQGHGVGGLTPVEIRTVGEVLDALDAIVDRCRAEGSPAGYFAALYRQVTRDVQDGIVHGGFEDPARMERLDVVFARRYLEAYAAHREGRPNARSWRVAFDASGRWSPTVLQHLLLGVNAHINLDLGIAAAEVAPGGALAALEVDFGRINDLLEARLDGVEEALSEIWPLLRILDVGAGQADETVVNFSIRRARAHAWSVARRLARTDGGDRSRAIAELDTGVAALGRKIRHPGWWLGFKLAVVRLGERGSVSEKIGILAR